jgi:putative holliday junction resolvase
MHDRPHDRAWVALAFDFGRKRIGVATGDSVTRRASPVTTLDCGTAGIDWATIARLVGEWRPALFVVGLPSNVDGSAAELTEPARQFARELEKRHGIAARTVDERYSSLDAAESLRNARREGTRGRRVQREDVDAAAACVILERWFASEAAAANAPDVTSSR